MQILVTGGAGYIGSHTVIALVEQGYDIVIADNFSNSRPECVRRLERILGQKLKLYELDLRDKAALTELFDREPIDCVIHFAGLKSVAESVSIPLAYYDNNLQSTVTLVEVMEQHGVKELIFSSSATVYSPLSPVPYREDGILGGCINPYGWTKYMCERILTDYAYAHKDWSIALLRYFNPIGAHPSGLIGEDPRDIPNNLLPYITQTATGRLKELTVYGGDYPTPDGTCIRDYIHVMDLAEGHVATIQYVHSHRGVEAFNLGTGKGSSVKEVISTFEQANGLTLPHHIGPRRPGDAPISYADPSKSRQLLGWQAKRSLYEMLKDSYRWQKNNPMGYETVE